MKTLFEKIIDKELDADFVYEDENIVAIKDKYPKAPVHLLIIPRKPIPNVEALTDEDFPLMGEIFRVAQQLAAEFGVVEKGYRLLVNNGAAAGQTIHHIHFHLLGGKILGMMG